MCRRVEAWAVVGCWTTCSMYASGPSIATKSNHNILLQYRLTCISVGFIISISFCFCLLFLHFWTNLNCFIQSTKVISWCEIRRKWWTYFQVLAAILDLCKLVHTNSRRQGALGNCNLLTKHPPIGTIQSNFLYLKTYRNICWAILLLV